MNYKFANLIFRGLTKKRLLEEGKIFKIIIPCNADVIVKANEHEKLRRIINENFATFDGQIPYWFAKIKNPGINFEKISGSDFIWNICDFAKKNEQRVFLIGGEEKSNKIAVQTLKAKYDIVIDGYSPPYAAYPFNKELNDSIMEKIINFKPHILCVGFGAIKQEFWIYDNREKLQQIGVKWAIGLGGTFDFVSGIKKRAPIIVQQLGLEGIYRFLIEPKWYRLKRLMISFKIFKYI